MKENYCKCFWKKVSLQFFPFLEWVLHLLWDPHHGIQWYKSKSVFLLYVGVVSYLMIANLKCYPTAVCNSILMPNVVQRILNNWVGQAPISSHAQSKPPTNDLIFVYPLWLLFCQLYRYVRLLYGQTNATTRLATQSCFISITRIESFPVCSEDVGHSGRPSIKLNKRHHQRYWYNNYYSPIEQRQHLILFNTWWATSSNSLNKLSRKSSNVETLLQRLYVNFLS